MNTKLPINSLLAANKAQALRQEQRLLLKTFWLGTIIFLLFEIYTTKTSSIIDILCAVFIAFAALLPLYLWCSGRALGIPVFPVFTLTYIWTYALPLVNEHPKVMAYSSEKHIFASITVVGFLLLGTFVWFLSVRKVPISKLKRYQVISGKHVDEVFFQILAISIIFTICINGGWLETNAGVFSVIRGLVLGLNSLSIFILAYRYGTKELPKVQARIFLILLILYIAANTVSLLLVASLSTVLLATIAFTLGRHKVPWLPLILVLLCLSFLHYGKGEMRDKYWLNSRALHYVQPWEYPTWYAEWAGYSLEYLSMPELRKEEKQSLSNRASLMHLLLLAQTKTPRDVPYLSGATYAIIPDLLVPRILNKNKIRSHEGTYILNIHYGLQDRIATLRTTIGWGLLNEAYANFGLLGCAGLAIALGAFYGQVSRWCLNTPMLSARSLFAVLLTSLAFRSEFSTGVYVTALFQSFVALIAIVLIFMSTRKRRQPLIISYGLNNSSISQQHSENENDVFDS